MKRVTMCQETSRKDDDLFYGGASIVIICAVFIGFARTYYLRGYFFTSSLPAFAHVHGLLFSSWILLFALQTVLIAVQRVATHRHIGLRGAVLAVLVVCVGTMIALASARANFAGGNKAALGFLTTPLGDMAVFGVLAGAGIWFRQRGDIHKRLMLLATIALLDAAFARWPVPIVAEGIGSLVAVDILVGAMLIHDLTSRGRLHPATVSGGVIVVAAQPLKIMLAKTAWWLAVARTIVG